MAKTAAGMSREEIYGIMLKNFQKTTDFELVKPILNLIPTDIIQCFTHRDHTAQILKQLKKKYKPEDCIDNEHEGHKVWNECARYFRGINSPYDALLLYLGLYDWMLQAEINSGERYHKGGPLVWIADCLTNLGFLTLSRRYLMLTLCEDSISFKGKVDIERTGVYHRLVWSQGMSDGEFHAYSRQAWRLYKSNPNMGKFPEWVLFHSEFDRNWAFGIPQPLETTIYLISQTYTSHLLSMLGDGQGIVLELLSEYLLSCMPGCRTYRRKKTHSTDLDIVCSLEGMDVDFRSEFGRYFLCECKDYKDPVGHVEVSRFCRVLQSVKCRFGIIFARNSISGVGRSLNAERELLKVYQELGLVILVVDEKDLQRINSGENFIWMLRKKYERVRLDTYK